MRFFNGRRRTPTGEGRKSSRKIEIRIDFANTLTQRHKNAPQTPKPNSDEKGAKFYVINIKEIRSNGLFSVEWASIEWVVTIVETKVESIDFKKVVS